MEAESYYKPTNSCPLAWRLLTLSNSGKSSSRNHLHVTLPHPIMPPSTSADGEESQQQQQRQRQTENIFSSEVGSTESSLSFVSTATANAPQTILLPSRTKHLPPIRIPGEDHQVERSKGIEGTSISSTPPMGLLPLTSSDNNPLECLSNLDHDDRNVWPSSNRTSTVSTSFCSSDCSLPFPQRTRIRITRRKPQQHESAFRLCRVLLLGALLGGLAVVTFFSFWSVASPESLLRFSTRMEAALFLDHGMEPSSFYNAKNRIRHPGSFSYSNLYEKNNTYNQSTRRRYLASIPSSSSMGGSSNPFFTGDNANNYNDDYKDTQLVIAGKMSVEDAPCNIAQYNLKKDRWSLTERIQLSLYNSYSGGEVYSLLANHTSTVLHDTDSSGREENYESKRYGYIYLYACVVLLLSCRLFCSQLLSSSCSYLVKLNLRAAGN